MVKVSFTSIGFDENNYDEIRFSQTDFIIKIFEINFLLLQHFIFLRLYMNGFGYNLKSGWHFLWHEEGWGAGFYITIIHIIIYR